MIEKRLRYMGEFLSRAGVRWRVELWQDSEEAWTPRPLVFEATPLEIEWLETAKEDVLCGSTATLRIESPSDRAYADLYTVQPGTIRMDVYRAGHLYWSGLLDPELYEEPYERAWGYEVTLTFTDMGILDRLKYDLQGLQSVGTIVRYALDRAQIRYNGITENISTSLEDGEPLTLDTLSVRSDNFVDENGEAKTLREAVVGVLQPLGLRLIQKNGRFYVYDLNALAVDADTSMIEWDGARQTMGVDKVANNVTVTFSPYAEETIIREAEYKGKTGRDRANFSDTNPNDPEYGEFYSFMPYCYDTHRPTSVDLYSANFSIFLGELEGLGYLSPDARGAKIVPMSGGDEKSCVAWGFYAGGLTKRGGASGNVPTPGRQMLHINDLEDGNEVVLKSVRAFLPKLADADRGKFLLRLKLDLLLDARYCPFSDMSDEDDGLGNRIDNYNDNDATIKTFTSWVFAPIGVTIYDADGSPLCHYRNRQTAEAQAQGKPGKTYGDWVPGAAVYGDAWLEYYNAKDQKECAVRGWHANRQCVGRPNDTDARRTGPMYPSFIEMADGEYMPYPPEGGYIEITIYKGVRVQPWRATWDFWADPTWRTLGGTAFGRIRWALYGTPALDIVNNNLVFDESNLDDIEYSGTLNVSAKDDIEIDTICGTTDAASPTARGAYYKTSDGLQIQRLQRAGVTDHPEMLYIGTLYSQYAERKTKLMGEAVLDPGGLCAYSERNQGDKKFIALGERQNAITDTTEAVLIELAPDEYEPQGEEV